MSEKPQGGPAFPCVIGDIYYKGMTLRDYFAGQAIVGLLHGMAARAVAGEPITPESFLVGSAMTAYGLADAMIAAREQ